jgi:hypothetical protein
VGREKTTYLQSLPSVVLDPLPLSNEERAALLGHTHVGKETTQELKRLWAQCAVAAGRMRFVCQDTALPPFDTDTIATTPL